MSVLQITCDNCGAKYKLPETFTGSQAKCQKCGSVIDVARQRAAAEAPAATARPTAAKPAAAAKPAVDRSKEAPKAAERAPAAASSRSERPTRRGKDGAADGEGKRGRGERDAKKSNSMPLILSGVGLVAIVVVVVLMMKGGGKPATDTTAKADTPAANQTPAAAPAAAPTPTAPAAGEGEKPAPAKPDAPKTETPTPAAATPPPAATPAEASATPDDPNRIKRPWEKMKNPPASMDQVADPKSYGEVKWPDGVDETKKAELKGLAEDVANGGRPGITAKPKLVKEGFLALYGIVEKLRLLDYKSAEDEMIAFELNKLIEEISVGMNARFEPVEATETIAPAKAEWNTRTVKAWIDILGRLDEETYKKERAERIKKGAADK